MGRGGQHLLAVVEDEHPLLGPDLRDDRLRDGAIGTSRHTERGGDRGGNQLGIGQGRQVDEDGAIGELRCHVLSDGQRQLGFAYPTRAGHGQQRNGLIQQERARSPAPPPGR